MKTVTIKTPCRVDGKSRRVGEVLETTNDQAMRLVAHGWATAGLSHGTTQPHIPDPDEVTDRDPASEHRDPKPKMKK